ncbi:abortive infection family protein [Desulfocurvus sp. DL9XJH121]
MDAITRIQLIKEIADSLQQYEWTDIQLAFNQFGVSLNCDESASTTRDLIVKILQYEKDGEILLKLGYYVGSSLASSIVRENSQASSKSLRPFDRVQLIDRISVSLQSQMTTREINVYLAGYKIDFKWEDVADSKRLYAMDILKCVDDSLILDIAHDLHVEIPGAVTHQGKQLFEILSKNGLTACQEDFYRTIEDSNTNPYEAIGHASSTFESICKAILDRTKTVYPKKQDIKTLTKAAATALNLAPDQHGQAEFKGILTGLSSAASGLGVLRTMYSSFHGKGEQQNYTRKQLEPRHARLAVNALSTIGVFFIETYIRLYGEDSM